MMTKYLYLPKEVCTYLNVPNYVSMTKLKEALEIISMKNNKDNKENFLPKKSTIYLDTKGKKLFGIKSNTVDLLCLIDIIYHNFADKIPDCHFFEYNQKPRYVSFLNGFGGVL